MVSAFSRFMIAKENKIKITPLKVTIITPPWVVANLNVGMFFCKCILGILV